VDYGQHYENLKRMQETWGHVAPDRWKAVSKYAKGAVLDVGCANGVYVQELRRINQTAFGVDLLHYEAWQQLGGIVAQADATLLPFADNSVDSIISFETIEHVPNPEGALREYHRVCRDTLVLSVPNAVTPDDLKRAGYTFHHWIDRSHVNFFNIDTITKLIDDCGFIPVETRLVNQTLPAYPLFRSLRVPPHLSSFFARGIRKISPVKYYMSILVIARKK